MMNYAKHVQTRVTPQTEQAKSNQIKNATGGYGFEVDDFKRLNKFLVIGCEGGSFYATEKKLTLENTKCVQRCLVENGIKTVQEIVRVSVDGRAPKNDAAIFALALACCSDDLDTREAAFQAIPHVCRIGTHLFQFVQSIKELRSFGKGLRKGLASWYAGKTPDELAFQICKYAQRNGMSHRDVLRLVHPVAPSKEHDAIYRYIVTGPSGGGERAVHNKKTGKLSEYEPTVNVPVFLDYFQELKTADEKRTIELIQSHGFTHEMIDTRHKNSPEVWEALLQRMPLHALIRNLNKMTAIGLIKPFSQAQKLVTARLGDEEKIHKSRLHPLTILGATRQYNLGRGDKGSLTWTPDPTVLAAMEGAFYKSFDSVEPSGKNMFLGIDVSGSMTWDIPGANMSSCCVVACIAMVSVRKEPYTHLLGFCDKLVDLKITSTMSLYEAQQAIQRNNFGATDCAQPMIWAKQNKIDVDVFATYTDGETNCGRIHPFQALKEYRNSMGKPNAKSVFMATTATNFTLADPSDPNMIDLCGFSNDSPQIISAFARD